MINWLQTIGYIFSIVSVLPSLTPNDPGEVSHPDLLHIEKGSPDAVEDMDSVLGRVRNRSEFDSCSAAVGNQESVDLAESSGSTPALEVAPHSLNPVRTRRVDRETGCRTWPADTALARTDQAHIQRVHTQNQNLQEDDCHQIL